MRRLLIAVALGVLAALPLVSAAAVVPIPVTGSYVQPVRVAGEVRGDWTTVACHIHVFTEADGAGETMTAEDGYSAAVRGVWSYDATSRADPFIAGRARFTVPAGYTLETTNTSPALSLTCPAS